MHARIGTVKFGGGVQSISVIAGADAGADGLFGTADDIVLGGTDDAKVHSKIAKIVIEGGILAGMRSAGIIAQFVESLVGTSNQKLGIEPGDDSNRANEIAEGSKINVFELPLP